MLRTFEAAVYVGSDIVSYSALSLRSNLKSSSIFVDLMNDEPHLMVADFGRVSPDDVNGHYGQVRLLMTTLLSHNSYYMYKTLLLQHFTCKHPKKAYYKLTMQLWSLAWNNVVRPTLS